MPRKGRETAPGWLQKAGFSLHARLRAGIFLIIAKGCRAVKAPERGCNFTKKGEISVKISPRMYILPEDA